MSSNDLQARFLELKEAILTKRPVLRQLLQKHGSKNLYQYAEDYIDVNLNPPIKRRQEEFIDTFKKEVAKRLSPEIAEGAAKQLAKYYFVSTADHQGPICSPFFVNSNLLTAAPCLDCTDPHLQYVIVLACANISVDNSSFPRGLTVHATTNGQLQLHRLAFFSGNTRPPVIYNLPPYTLNELQKIDHNLDVKLDKGEIQKKHVDTLRALFQDIYHKPEVLACPDYSTQVTKTNLELWRRFFAPSKTPHPQLVYLELESLVVRLIVEHHLFKDTTIHRILFSPHYEPLIRQYFDGIFGAFSTQDNAGTYLFWALPKESRYAVQLFKEGNFLVSKDRSYRIELIPETIQKALLSRELIPSLMLDYIVVAFYYGVKCLGGFNQVNYLTFMKNAYIKMLVDRENYRGIEVCARSQTKEQCEGFTIAFLEDAKKRIVPATGLDLILYGSDLTWRQFLENSKTITFEEALCPLIPEIYKITYSEDEWDPSLVSITSEDIAKFLELDKKIKPCAYLT